MHRDLTPDNLTAACDLLYAQGKEADALELVLKVSAHTEDVTLLMAAYGVLLKHTAQHELMITVLRKALLLLPKEPRQLMSVRHDLTIHLANQLMAIDEHETSVSLYMDVLKEDPNKHLSIGENLSVALLEAGLADQAKAVLDGWFADGSYSVSLYNNMGCALERLNRSEEAITYYQKSLDLAPSHETVSFGYSMSLLKAGRFEEGFQRYALRSPMVVDPSVWFIKTLYRLTPDVALAGKHLLLYQEQGFGDTIQFVRFVPRLIEQGARVTLAVPEQLVRIMRRSFPDAHVRLIGDVADDVHTRDQYHFSCPIPDLPYICGMRSEADIPRDIPYLTVPNAAVEAFSQRIEALMVGKTTAPESKRRLRVGLVWAGGKRSSAKDVAADRRRSTSLRAMMEALAPAEVDFFSLQYGEARPEVENDHPQPIYDLMDHVADVEDTAALMKNLDLVISVDTAPLHIAGAVGVPVWLVNRWDSCWRWGDAGETSAWYPTLRIFRAQERSFGPVLQDIGAALKALVAGASL